MKWNVNFNLNLHKIKRLAMGQQESTLRAIYKYTKITNGKPDTNTQWPWNSQELIHVLQLGYLIKQLQSGYQFILQQR